MLRVTTGGGPDATPAAFQFTDVTDKPPGTVVLSEVTTISGLGAPVDVSIAGDPSARYRINGGASRWASGTIANGDTLQLRLVSSTTADAQVSAVVTVGTFSTDWTVQTAPDLTPNAFDFADVTGRPPNVGTLSNIVTISGLSRPVAVTASGDPSSRARINGGPLSTSPGMVTNGDQVQLRLISSPTPGATVSGQVNIGTANDTWFVTTAP